MSSSDKPAAKSGTIPSSARHRRGRSYEDKGKSSEKPDDLLFGGSLFPKSADDTQAEYFGSTAADFILRTLLTEFKEHTQGKIEEIMKFSIDEKFFLSDIFESDPKIHQLISSMSEIAKYHISTLVESLLKWRTLQLELVKNLKSDSQKSRPSKDASLMEERNYLAIEYIFCSAMLPIVDCLGTSMGDQLRPELCLELENLAFHHFRPVSEAKTSVVSIDLGLSNDSSRTTLEINRRKIPTMYAKIVGILSKYRMQEIAPRFLKEITAHSVRSKKAIFVIHAVRFVKLNTNTAEGLEQGCNFISALLQLFKASQRVEVKQALSELVLRLLRPHVLLFNQSTLYKSSGASNIDGIKSDDEEDDEDEELDEVDTEGSDEEVTTKTNSTPSKSTVVSSTSPKRAPSAVVPSSAKKSSAKKSSATGTPSKTPPSASTSPTEKDLKETKDTVDTKSAEPAPKETLAATAAAATPSTTTPLSASTGSLTMSGSPPTHANYHAWFKMLLELYLQKGFQNKKKPKVNKDLLATLPMKTALLCALHVSDFDQHFWPCMLQFVELLKDTKATGTALECMLILIEAFLLKCPEDDSLEQKLEEVTVNILGCIGPKRQILSWKRGKGDPLDIFVDFVCTVAKSKLKFAMENIVFRLLSVKDSSLQPEKVMVGVLAVRELWTSATEGRPLSTSKLYKGEEPPSAATHSYASLVPYIEKVSTYWWQLITALDLQYGNLLYSTQAKPLYDLIRPDKDGLSIELLRTIIFCIPTIMPKTDDQKLVRLLSKYLIHLDRGIGEMATGALSRLMADRSPFRGIIIHGVSEFVLAIPHNRHDLVFTLFFKLGQLLKRWVELLRAPFADSERDAGSMGFAPSTRATEDSESPSINSEAPDSATMNPHPTDKLPAHINPFESNDVSPSAAAVQQLETFPIDKVEGIALIFLCSPRAKIRLLSLEILRSVRGVENELNSIIHTALEQNGLPVAMKSASPFRKSGVRVMDIIDETGPDIFKYLQKERSSGLRTALAQQSMPLTVKTIERLAARESRDDQLLWSHAFAEILKYVTLVHSAPSIYACSLVLSRFQSLEPDESDTRLFTVEQEEMTYWWRNYIVAACATIPSKFNHRLFKYGLTNNNYKDVVGDRRDSGHADTPTNQKELFLTILPLLKSSSEVHRDAAVMALQRTNFTAYTALFTALRPLEKEFQGDYDKKRKPKKDRLRYEITSIYTYIAEYMRPGTLANETLKQYFVSFAQEASTFLGNNRNLLELLPLRHQFTVLSRRVAEELHLSRQKTHFDDDQLRKALFYLLMKWCIPESMSEEAVRKHLGTVLNTVKDADKRAAYVNALRQHVFTVQLSAFQAMSACLMGPHFETILPSDNFFNFVHTFLHNPAERVRYLARLMLETFLQGNLAQPHVLQITFNNCFNADPDISSNYFLCLVELFPEEKISCPPILLVHLIVYMLGDRQYLVRKNAHELLLMLKSLTREEERWQNIPFVIESSLHENFEQAQVYLSIRLAQAHKEHAAEFVNELVSRIDSVSPTARRQMLRYVLPWIEKLELSQMSMSALDHLVDNLLLVTLKYENELRYEAENIWSTLAAQADNISVLIRKLLTVGIQKQNLDFIPLTKLICVYLARKVAKVVVDCLVAELSSMDPSLEAGRPPEVITPERAPVIPPVITKSRRARGSRERRNKLRRTLSGKDVVSGGSIDRTPKDDASRSPSVAMTPSVVPPLALGSANSTASPPESTGPGAGTLPADSTASATNSGAKERSSKASKGAPGSEEATRRSKRSGSASSADAPFVASAAGSGGGGSHRMSDAQDIRKSMLDTSEDEGSSDTESSTMSSSIQGSLHPLHVLIPHTQRSWGLTRGHFTLIILAQLTYETSECFREHLPIIFQLAFLGLDYEHALVHDHCRIILLNIIHSLIVVPLAAVESKSPVQIRTYDEALELEQYLKSFTGKPLWANEDITLRHPEVKSAALVASLVQTIISIFSGAQIEIGDSWATQALSWAVNCQNWHISGRSFQIYRALKPSITRDAQNDLLECLLRSLAQARKSPRESLPLTLEILQTLQTLVRSMSSQKLILFPQIFWAAVAFLHTDYEQHYFHALQLLCDLIDRIPFGDKYVQNIFSASIPKEWVPPFRGVQPLAIRGLFSPVTEAKSIELLAKLTLSPYDEVFHPESGRLMVNMMALLPFLCSNLKIQRDQCSEIALSLSQACANRNYPQLARLFSRFSTGEFTSMEDFIAELRRPLARALAPFRVESALSLLFDLLDSGPVRWGKSILLIAYNLVHHKLQPQAETSLTDAVGRRPSIASHEAEKTLKPAWIATLLRMIGTNAWRQALPILDLVLQQSRLSDPFDASQTNLPKSEIALASPRGGPKDEPKSPRDSSLLIVSLGSSTSSLPHPDRATTKFSNRPERGVHTAALALDKILSTEQRRRLVTIDRSVFSMFITPLSDEITKEIEEEKLTTEQQIDYLLNAEVESKEQSAEKESKEAEEEPEAEDEVDIAAATFNKATFGRFPTFRGFEELLAKLESLPSRPIGDAGGISLGNSNISATEDSTNRSLESSRKTAEPDSDSEREAESSEFAAGSVIIRSSPKVSKRNIRELAVDTLSASTTEDSEAFPKSRRKRSSGKTSAITPSRPDEDNFNGYDDNAESSVASGAEKLLSDSGSGEQSNLGLLRDAPLSATTKYKRAKRGRSTSTGGSPLSGKRASAMSHSVTELGTLHEVDEKLRSKSARSAAQLRRAIVENEQHEILSPFSTMRKKLSFTFNELVLKSTKHWRFIQTQQTEDSESFSIFPAATTLVKAIREDFVASLPSYLAYLASDNQILAKYISAGGFNVDENRVTLMNIVPDTMSNMVSARYKRKLKRNPSFSQSFREQQAKLIEEINQLQMGYIEKKLAVEEARRHLAGTKRASNNSDKKDSKAQEEEDQATQLILTLLELHFTILKLIKTQTRMQALANDVLQSDSHSAASNALKALLDEDLTANRKVWGDMKSETGPNQSTTSGTDRDSNI